MSARKRGTESSRDSEQGASEETAASARPPRARRRRIRGCCSAVVVVAVLGSGLLLERCYYPELRLPEAARVDALMTNYAPQIDRVQEYLRLDTAAYDDESTKAKHWALFERWEIQSVHAWIERADGSEESRWIFAGGYFDTYWSIPYREPKPGRPVVNHFRASHLSGPELVELALQLHTEGGDPVRVSMRFYLDDLVRAWAPP